MLKTRFLLVALVCCACTSLSAQSVWEDMQEHDDILYLLRKSPAQIMRYDLEQEAWLAPLSLDSVPQAFILDDDHIFISYGRWIGRIDYAGANATHVANSSDDVNQLLIDDNLLFANRTAGLYARMTVLEKTSFEELHRWQDYVNGIAGASIAPGSMKIFGRSRGYSPSDLNYVQYDAAGTITGTGETPYHGDYPGASRTWVFPNESKVVDDSGTVYNLTDLTYNNSFGTQLDDLDFHGVDIPIALVEDELIAYSNTLLETGRYKLGQVSQSIHISGDSAYVFYEDTSATKVGVEIVSLDDFEVGTPGEPISPKGLAYTVDSVFATEDGTIYLLSKGHSSLFRWDLGNQEYLETIPLPEAMSLMVHSEALNRIYLYSASRRIYKIDLDSTPLAAQHFANVPLNINTLMPLNEDLFALINGSWDDQWIYDENGTLLNSNINCCYDDYHFYDSERQLIYYDGSVAPYLGDGTFGTPTGGSLHGGSFIQLSPDGDYIIDTAGKIYDASDRQHIDQLSNDIVAAQWSADGTLFTLKKPGYTGSSWDPVYDDFTTVQKWTEYYSIDSSVVVDGQFIDLFIAEGSVAVVTSVDGTPLISKFDLSLDLLPPDSLEAPMLEVQSFAATAATLTWGDVFGDEGFAVERKRDDEAEWSEIGSAETSDTFYRDASLVPGHVYEFRIKAVNGIVESEYSNVVSIDLLGVVDQRADPSTLNFVADEMKISDDNMVYLLSKENKSIFVWDAEAQDWSATIPLEGEPSFFTLSDENDALYTMYADGKINSIGVNAVNPIEFPFADFSSHRSMHGIVAADEYVVVSVANSNWDEQYSLDPSGVIVNSASTRYEFFSGAVWSPAAGNIYHFRDGTSPNDLIRTPIEPDGTIGADIDSPYHSSSGIRYPIRVKPDGSIVVLGSGRIYDATTLEHIDSLAFEVDDAIWIPGDEPNALKLLTLSDGVLYTHSSTTYAFSPVFEFSLPVQRLLPINDGGFVVAFTNNAGGTTFDLYDSNSTRVLPDSLATPGGLEGEVLGPDAAKITWVDVAGEGGYRVERRIRGADVWLALSGADGNNTAFTDNGITEGNVYEYRVTAINGDMESAPSAIVEVDFSLPKAPSDFVAEALTFSEISLSWNPVEDAAGYVVERRASSATGSWQVVVKPTADTTTYTDTNLEPATEYLYRIASTNALGDGTDWSEATATTDGVTPATPTLSLSGVTPTEVRLSIGSAAYAVQYVLERKEGGDGSATPWTEAKRLTSAGSYEDGEVESERTYSYRVFAVNETGTSGHSPVVTASTPPLPLPTVPGLLVAVAQSSSEIELTWRAAEYAHAYLLERSVAGTGIWEQLAELEASITNYVDASVEDGVEYEYRLKATNSEGSSDYSGVAAALAYDFVLLVEDDFDPDLDPSLWNTFYGGRAVTSAIGFQDGNAFYFDGPGTRSATTSPFSKPENCYVSFSFRAGNAADGSMWNNSEGSEYVVLEASTDGINWTVVEILETEYPANHDWAFYHLPVSVGAPGDPVTLRWRQISHSGNRKDVWAIDNARITGDAPDAPDAPPFILAAPSSASSISLLWIGVPEATGYILERHSLNGAEIVAELPAHQTFYTDTDLAADSSYLYRVAAISQGGPSDFSRFAQAITYSQFNDWVFENFDSRDDKGKRAPLARGEDGITNLARFAFLMNAETVASTLNPDAPQAGGMPRVFIDEAGHLCVQFIRRTQRLNPGVEYAVEYSSDLETWSEAGTVADIEPVGAGTEVVIWQDTTEGGNFSKRYVRIRLIAK